MMKLYSGVSLSGYCVCGESVSTREGGGNEEGGRMKDEVRSER